MGKKRDFALFCFFYQWGSFKMVSTPFNDQTLASVVHSCCATTSSITVTSPLTAHGHSPQHRRRAQTVYTRSRWRPRVSPSTSRSSVSNPRSTFTEYHPEHPTGLSGEGERGRPRRWGGVNECSRGGGGEGGDLRTELIRWPQPPVRWP